MKLTRAFKATLILTLFFIANVQDLILHSKLENMRILQAKKHRKAHHNKTNKVAKKHQKHHAVAKKHNSRGLKGAPKKKKSAKKAHAKKSAHKKRTVKAAHKKHTRKLSKTHAKSKKHSKIHHKTKHHKKNHRSLRSRSYDVSPFSAFDSLGGKVGPSDSITTLIFIILLILMLGAFLNRKPNRKLDQTDSGASGIGGLNILDLLMGGNDIKDIMKKEKKKIMRFMKDNNITLDDKTPYKDVLRLTRTYVKKEYNMDEEAFEQFKPLVKKFYKKLIKDSKEKNLKDKEKPKANENQNEVQSDKKASSDEKPKSRRTRRIYAL